MALEGTSTTCTPHHPCPRTEIIFPQAGRVLVFLRNIHSGRPGEPDRVLVTAEPRGLKEAPVAWRPAEGVQHLRTGNGQPDARPSAYARQRL